MLCTYTGTDKPNLESLNNYVRDGIAPQWCDFGKQLLEDEYVTGPEKTGLIYTKYTHPYYGIYLFIYVCYLNSVSFIEILRTFCVYGEMFSKIVC